MPKSEADCDVELRRMIASGEARTLRINAGTSQRVIAKTLEVDTVTLFRWEKGISTPRGRNAREYYKLLRRLAKAQAEAT